MRKLDDRELSRTWARYLADRQERDRNALVEHYYPLIRITVQRSTLRRKIQREKDDFEAELVPKLIRTIERYDPSFSAKPESWIIGALRWHLLTLVRTMDGHTKTLDEFWSQRERARELFIARMGRLPSWEELAAEMGMTADQYHRKRRVYVERTAPVSWHIHFSDDEKSDGETERDLNQRVEQAGATPGPETRSDLEREVLDWLTRPSDNPKTARRKRIAYNHLFRDELLREQRAWSGMSESNVHWDWRWFLEAIRQHLEERGFTP